MNDNQLMKKLMYCKNNVERPRFDSASVPDIIKNLRIGIVEDGLSLVCNIQENNLNSLGVDLSARHIIESLALIELFDNDILNSKDLETLMDGSQFRFCNILTAIVEGRKALGLDGDETISKKEADAIYNKYASKDTDPLRLLTIQNEVFYRAGIQKCGTRGIVQTYLGEEYSLMRDLFALNYHFHLLDADNQNFIDMKKLEYIRKILVDVEKTAAILFPNIDICKVKSLNSLKNSQEKISNSRHIDDLKWMKNQFKMFLTIDPLDIYYMDRYLCTSIDFQIDLITGSTKQSTVKAKSFIELKEMMEYTISQKDASREMLKLASKLKLHRIFPERCSEIDNEINDYFLKNISRKNNICLAEFREILLKNPESFLDFPKKITIAEILRRRMSVFVDEIDKYNLLIAYVLGKEMDHPSGFFINPKYDFEFDYISSTLGQAPYFYYYTIIKPLAQFPEAHKDYVRFTKIIDDGFTLTRGKDIVKTGFVGLSEDESIRFANSNNPEELASIVKDKKVAFLNGKETNMIELLNSFNYFDE